MFSHIDLQVTNAKSHVPFWEWLLVSQLGWTQLDLWETGSSWQSRGDAYLVIKAGDVVCVPESIALTAKSRAAINATWAQLEAHGAELLWLGEQRVTDGSEQYAAYFRDPGGIKIEIVWSPKSVTVERRLRDLTDGVLIERWCNILGSIHKELVSLSYQRHAMEAVKDDILNPNPRFLGHNGRRFVDLMRNWYAGAMALAYRRQDDADQDSASLHRLLDEMKTRPDAYRIEIVRPFIGGVATDEVIRAEVMAPVLDGNGHLNLEMIEQDLLDLAMAGVKVRAYVNNFVAHTDFDANQNAPAEVVTYTEIYAAHKVCERIAERWLSAFSVYRYPLDVQQPIEWLDVFDFPWRHTRPTDDAETRRYIVTVDACLSEEETLSMFSGDDNERQRHRREEVDELIYDADALAVNGKLSAQSVLPSLASVERIL